MSSKRSSKEKGSVFENFGELDRIEVRFLAELRRRMKSAGLMNRDVERRLRVKSETVSPTLLGRMGLTFRSAYRYCKALGLEFVPAPGIGCRKTDNAFPALPRNMGRRVKVPHKARRRKRSKQFRNYTYEIKYFRNRASFDPVACFLQQVVTRMKETNMRKSELARRMGTSRAYVHNVLSGEIGFTFKTAIKIAAALGGEFDPVLIPWDDSRKS